MLYLNYLGGVESRDDKRPRLGDLRDSGAIEQDADVVMMLYRDNYYNPQPDNEMKAEVIVAKNRNGSTGTVEVEFIKDKIRFQACDHRYV